MAEAAQKQEFNTNEDFEALLESSFGEQKVTEGSVVEGEIIGLSNDTVTIDVGLKSEGRVALKEFYEMGEKPDLHEGDKVTVYIERLEDRSGEIILSREKAVRESAWDNLEEDHKSNVPVDGVLFGQVKGGFTVDLGGAIAFLPGSQVDVKPIKDVSHIANVKEKYLILKMDKKRGNIIVSRRAIMEESQAEARDEILKDIAMGAKLEGTVKNLTNYGAFIDLGGIDGLLHVTDISWKRINHPSEVLSVGEKIEVQVIKIDDETKRISLGMKQLQENPWDANKDKFKVGEVVKTKVSNVADYGVFVELEGGLEGLIHQTELSWLKKEQNSSKWKVGEEIEAQILEVDEEKQRISLGLKQTQENPWGEFAKNFKEGDEIEGEIRNISDFGFFVGLEGGIDGLVHYSDLAWDKPGEEALKEYSKGQTVKAQILSVDIEKERIGLGIKQLIEGGAAEGFDQFNKGDVVTCKVTAVQGDGLEVTLGETEVIAFIKRGDLSKDRSEQRPERFAVGDRVDAKITAATKKTGRISVSVKALEVDEHKRAIEEYGSTDSGASLGDILGAALEEKGKK